MKGTMEASIHYENALIRVLGYLRLAGIQLRPDAAELALRIVSDLIEESGAPVDDTELTKRALDRLRERLDVGPGTIPPVAPALRRSSIGYAD